MTNDWFVSAIRNTEERRTMTTIEPEPEQADTGEPEHVTAWRYITLQMAGYTEEDALLLANRPEVDLHRACELLGRCGDPTLALRILL